MIVMSLLMAVAPTSTASAAPLADDLLAALDIDPATVASADYGGDPGAIGLLSTELGGFPQEGPNALVLSTGQASDLLGDRQDFRSTDLDGALAGADGNDLTQARLVLNPPPGANCLGFDFAFLSEEYPEFVGSSFNDIFTAELNESYFDLSELQVVAPNNFAYDSQGNAVSINTVFGLAEINGTAMNGATPPLTATTPIETASDGSMELILSIQDLGDSIYDSAVIVDNLRWLYGPNCARGATALTDTDGDGLPDEWELNGIDYNGDGVADLDLPAMGADPHRKDIFVEVDWMEKPATSCIWIHCWGDHSYAPQQAALDDVREAFAGAPVANPDGSTGITLHIDSGPESIMDPETGATWEARSRAGTVPYAASLGAFSDGKYDWSALDTFKESHFDTARRDAFHYALYAETFADSGSSGISRGIPGSDFLITDGHESWEGGFTRTQERGTFMHELGHNLSLRHGGDVHAHRGPEYRSVMNYYYQLEGLPPPAGLDYSSSHPFDDWSHLRFDGGSVGDLGDEAPLPQLTEPDSIDAETARELNAYAKVGDGLVRFIGPNVLLPGTETQQLIIDVDNVSSEAGDYTVDLATDMPGFPTSAEVTVAAESTERLTVPIATDELAPGTHEVTLTLSSTKGGEGLSSVAAEITIPDLSDPVTLNAAVAALEDLRAGSQEGLGAAVKEQLVAMLSAAFDGESEEPPVGPVPQPPPVEDPDDEPPPAEGPDDEPPDAALCPDDGAGPSFADVDPVRTHGLAILCLAEAEIINGFLDGTFGPTRTTTRAQFAAMMARTARILELSPTGVEPDIFVDDVSPHEADIAWMAALGVIEGYADGTFRPSEPVTRAQTASILARFWTAVTGDQLPPGESRFADVDGVHQDSIQQLTQAGIIEGRPDGTFGPGQATSRAQMATLIHGVADRLLGLTSEPR